MASKKRLFGNEFENVSEMRVSKAAKIHGMLTALSPMKTGSSGSKPYFEGQLTDGEKQRRVIGFDAKVQKSLSEFHENKDPVAMSNCEVKVGKYTSDLEVIVRHTSQLQKSPKKFDFDMSKFEYNDEVLMLNELPRLSNFQKVSVKVKVVSEKEVEIVKGGLRKQEYIIADSSGTSMITTWGDNVGVLQEGESYKLSGLSVRTYCNKKFLSIPKDNFTIAIADDIGEVVDYGEVEKERKMTGVVILGIKFFEVYSGCYSCRGKVTPTTDKLGDCSRCGTT